MLSFSNFLSNLTTVGACLTHPSSNFEYLCWHDVVRAASELGAEAAAFLVRSVCWWKVYNTFFYSAIDTQRYYLSWVGIFILI